MKKNPAKSATDNGDPNFRYTFVAASEFRGMYYLSIQESGLKANPSRP